MKTPTLLDGFGRPARVSGFTGSGYRGAEWSRNRGYMPGYLADSKRELTSFTREELMRKSRFLKKNVGMIRGVAKSLVDLAIGPGVFVIPDTASDEFNELAFDYFLDIAAIGDVGGRMTFWEKQRAGVLAKFFDGDCFTLLTQSRHGWPQWQFIRGHNCGNFGIPAEDESWTDGVQLDGVSRARNYRFRLRGDDRYTSIPANRVIHGYMLEEPDQVRGVTALAHAINDLHDVLEAMEIEHGAIKDNARVSRVIKTESGEDEEEENYLAAAADVADDESPLPLEKIFGAEIARLKRGESLESFVSARPSPTFMGWIDYIGRGVTAGCGFPYEWAWDPKGITGPAQRAILERVKVAAEEWRANEVKNSRVFYTYAIAKGIQSGRLPAPPPDWWEHTWFAGARDVTIDRGRDGRELREAVLGGFKTLKEFHAANGRWWQHELNQQADEVLYRRRIAKEKGLDPADLEPKRASSPGGTRREEDDEPPAEEDEDEPTKKR